MIEKELKYLLSKVDYFKLKQYFESYGENKRLILIKTYYYDTIPYSLLPSIVFRIRIIENTAEIFLSVKANIKGRLPSEEKSELQIAKELNYKVNNLKLSLIENEFPLEEKELFNIGLDEESISFITQFKKDLNINKNYLKILGISEIERLTGNLSFYNMPFDLDHTKYYKYPNSPNYFEDYELEVEDENPDKYINIIQTIFNQKDIKSLGSEKKIRRLLKYITLHDN
ncbi:MAG: CYTH domain-containing protein [Exilispira sp.]|jgi:uncharacterized protein YjbK|nr:CYTH domain-containing protein [Exilispira sp.]